MHRLASQRIASHLRPSLTIIELFRSPPSIRIDAIGAIIEAAAMRADDRQRIAGTIGV
jgi:hypothetical protein